jgi:hypothetical protein
MNKKESRNNHSYCYLLEGEGFRAKRYALDHMDYIQIQELKISMMLM